VASEVFEKAGRPSLPDTEARPPVNSASPGKREKPFPEAPPAPNATRPDDASSKQSASKVEDPSAPDTLAASPPNAMVQEGASSERVTSEEPIASRTAAVPSAASRSGAARTETAAYIARAHAKIQQGDIAAARRLLERALGSDDGDAWFVLAETYDPQILAGWRVIGIKPDLEKAKTLYQEAQRRGAQGAPKRLLALRN
jgi:Tetratricopeptide repeat